MAWPGCATSTTGGCGTGTCTRQLNSGCGDACGNGIDEDCSGADAICPCPYPNSQNQCGGCGDGKAKGSEQCDWGCCRCRNSHVHVVGMNY